MTIALAVRAAMQGEWSENGTPLKVALLTGLPTTTSGVFDITGVEQDGDGYARAPLAVADVGAVSGIDPTTRTNTAEVTFPANSGTTPWSPVGYVAVLNAAGTEVLTVAALNEWLTVEAGEAMFIAAGGLVLSL